MNERIIYRKPQAQIDAEVQDFVDQGFAPADAVMMVSEVAVIIPADKSFVEVGGTVRAMTAQEIMTKDLPPGATNARMASINEVPNDRLFRNAWNDSNPEPVIGVDVVKAKHKAHLVRKMRRQEQLAPLDAEENFATTTPARKALITDEKLAILAANAQVQADIDAAIDEVATPVVADASAIKNVLSAAGML